MDVQYDAGFKTNGGSEVGARREGDPADGVGGVTSVYGGLDGGGVVVDAVPGCAEVGDGNGERGWGEAEDR